MWKASALVCVVSSEAQAGARWEVVAREAVETAAAVREAEARAVEVLVGEETVAVAVEPVGLAGWRGAMAELSGGTAEKAEVRWEVAETAEETQVAEQGEAEELVEVELVEVGTVEEAAVQVAMAANMGRGVEIVVRTVDRMVASRVRASKVAWASKAVG